MADRDELAGPALPEESAEDLFENAPCGYVSTLPGGTILKVNQTLLTWTGHRREDLVGRRRFQDLLTPGGRIYHETHYAPLLQMQGSVREIAAEVVCADGRRLPVLISSALQRDAAGAPLSVRTVLSAAADRREYERELLRERQRAERATRAKADFISMISHEIRTPLTAILGAGQLLEATDLSAKQQRFVGILRSSSESLLSLVNGLLDFSKVELGKLSLEERSFDLRRLVHDLVEGPRITAGKKGIALGAQIDERLPDRLVGDPVKIGQVLTNLLGNALKFTAAGSVTVTLAVRELAADAVTVDFRVADTGIGIAPDRLSDIFDEFTQASYDIGQRYGGTGLGLAISRKLVELHGSRIDVESEPGRGATFSFALRLRIAAEGGETPGAGTA